MSIERLEKNSMFSRIHFMNMTNYFRKDCRGFSLLEIMVAVALLAIAATTLLTFHGNSLITSGRAENITIAAMLARYKITEIELDLKNGMKKGEFPDEKTDEGSFEKPYEDYKWKMTIKSVKLPTAAQQQDEASLTGMISRQLSEEIAKIVREVKIEVIWEEMEEEQSIDVVTHIVKL